MMKPQAKLDEMPRLAKEKIVDALDWADRQRLRTTTTSYHHVVDVSAVHIDRLFICFCRRSIDVFYYQTDKSRYCTHNVHTPSSPTYARLTPTEFAEKVVAELEVLFRNPQLTIDQLVVSFGMQEYGLGGNLQHFKSRLCRFFYTLRSDMVCYYEFFKALTRSMSSLFGEHRKLKVKAHAVFLSNRFLVPDNFAYFLKYLDPKVLTSYQIENVETEYNGSLSEIYFQDVVKFYTPSSCRLENLQILNYDVKLRLADVKKFSRFEGSVKDVTENHVRDLVLSLMLKAEEVSFDISTPDLSAQAALASLGPTRWRNHENWRRFATAKFGTNLIFMKMEANRFIIYCEPQTPEIDDYDLFS